MDDRERLKSLYTFLRDFTKLRSNVITNYKNHEWIKFLSEIHDEYDDISLFYRDKTEEEEVPDDDLTLLRIHRPNYTEKCPSPYPTFKDWLLPGWTEFIKPASVEDKKLVKHATEDSEAEYESFEADETRVRDYRKWYEERKIWVEKQLKIKNTRDLFLELYQCHTDLERESETLEMIVACGRLIDKNSLGIDHPVLTKRVKTIYDAKSDTISIVDTDVSPELYSGVLQTLQDVQTDCIKSLSQELAEKELHPLDRHDTPDYLKVLIRRLSKDGVYVESDNSLDKDGRLFIYYQPMFIVRKRTDGALKALEAIIDDIEEVESLPLPLTEIVSGGTIDVPEDKEESIEEQLAAVGGEDVDILLSKEANREQLEIARRVERYNAVLVQGPPGTGKTHTIANLLGHFLAQGKSVLVTSHTKKALSVLKEKVEYGIQDLCVSILDDSNKDMESSVDGITNAMGRMTSMGLKREIESIKSERESIIKELGETRRKLYSIINSEKQTIVYDGEGVSPTEAAKFLNQNQDRLSYIPGKVEMNAPLPLSIDELSDLYKSNSLICEKDEKELSVGLPNPEELPDVERARELFLTEKTLYDTVESIVRRHGWKLDADVEGYAYRFSKGIHVKSVDTDKLEELSEYLAEFKSVEKWMKAVIIDGKRGGAYEKRWRTLKEGIDQCCQKSEEYIEYSLGKKIGIPQEHLNDELVPKLDCIIDILERKGKISKVDLFLKPSVEQLLKAVTLNGKTIKTKEDALCIKHMYVARTMREGVGRIWDELLTPHGVEEFAELDYDSPELYAQKRLKKLEPMLNWYDEKYQHLKKLIDDAGLDLCEIAGIEDDDSDNEELDKLLSVIGNELPDITDALLSYEQIKANAIVIESYKSVLQSGDRESVETCVSVVDALDKRDIGAYALAYETLKMQFSKNDLQRKRGEYLERIARVAPKWAEAIMNREGIHGKGVIPEDIRGAWKWKQYIEILDNLTNESYSELQNKSLSLSKEYRTKTGKYAEKLAWYHLLKNTEADIDMKQALVGWKLTVKKIGKGTGKNAPMYRRQARELMAKCQKAVPAWIMTINKALESLDPHTNKFDVVIVDEASQSDISALAILYMAKKVIIVGDDKQVSPLAVGINVDEITALIDMHLTGVVANAHLYTTKTSLYDIAATTFQPLMLREHFRCVPEIIGFSNGLSYDYKIRPLRDESDSKLLPAVVQYRVASGRRSERSKINPEEGKSIIALMKACMEQPEYEGKTFGVISMLADEQAKYIRKLIASDIDPIESENRKILCGDAANFQGDERDVVFLSLVDSNEGEGSLRMPPDIDGAQRKRYNVAASRARDQLWVVNSLDSGNDLKEGDYRKRLIDYAINPQSFAERVQQINVESESPFEQEVAKSLVARGYNIVQQWKVGSYRLDMVAIYNNLKIAIECDGEAYHSSEEQIRADMERQTILERCGWRFIRIRGSEYFCNPEKTMDSVVAELNKYGIMPQNPSVEEETSRDTELLQRVKARALEMLNEMNGEETSQSVDIDTIAAALESVPVIKPEIIKPVVDSSASIPIENECLEEEEKPIIVGGENKTIAETIPEEIEKKQKKEDVEEKPQESITARPLRSAGIAEVYRRVSDTSESKGRGVALKITYDLSSVGLKFVDRSKSRIIWVIYDESRAEDAQRIFEKYDCRYSLEDRGAIATGGVKAWRAVLPQ